jgi:predicted neuraminidase
MRTHVIATKGARYWQGIPGIERAPNGRLWCAFYSGGPKEPHPDNRVLLTTSADDGRTWSAPEVAVAFEGPARAYDPTLWHDPHGWLWLIYNRADREARDFSVWARTTEASGAADPTWSAPTKLDLDVPFAFRMNKPTVLSDGTWALPVTWASARPEGWFDRGSERQGVALSTDGGAHWTLHGAVEAPAWALESMVVERRDGVLWMLIRTGAGVLWESRSTDGGYHWTEGAPTRIVNPGARFFIRRLNAGRLLLINTFHPARRRGLHACLRDPGGGRRFSRCLQLDDREAVSYPDAVQAPDGRIYAVHDYDRRGTGEIVLSVFAESEILGGELGTPAPLNDPSRSL